MARLYNKNTEEAQLKLEHYRKIFHDRESQSLLITTNIKRINHNFWQSMRNTIRQININEEILKNSRGLNLDNKGHKTEKNAKKKDYSKGIEEMLYLKKF